MSLPESTLAEIFAQLYQDALAFHGEIDVPSAAFESRIQAVIEKHLGFNQPMDGVPAFLHALHTTDLYLAVGCSQPSDRAWRRFVATYAKYITDIAMSITSLRDAGNELAADVLSNLFLYDRSGKSRIASYDGQQSLATWLLAVISHRATNEARRKWTTFERLDYLFDLKEESSINRIEADLRASSYRSVIRDCFVAASESLTIRERLILLLRFEEGLRIAEIAKRLNVHPSGVSHQLQHTYEKLNRKMISNLANKHRLGPAAIRECLSDILENPEHSIIVLIREADDRNAEQAMTIAH